MTTLVGDVITDWQRDHGRTGREAATSLKVTPQHVTDIVHGRRRLTDAAILRCTDQTLRADLARARIRELKNHLEAFHLAAFPPPSLPVRYGLAHVEEFK